MEERFVQVYASLNLYDANLVKSLLEGNNIPCTVLNEQLSGKGVSGGPIQIMVRQNDLKKAEEVLDVYFKILKEGAVSDKELEKEALAQPETEGPSQSNNEPAVDEEMEQRDRNSSGEPALELPELIRTSNSGTFVLIVFIIALIFLAFYFRGRY